MPTPLPTSSARILSPCISICVLDADTGWCLGCYRSRDEIQSWPRQSAAEKLSLLEEIKKRRFGDPRSYLEKED